MCSIRASSPISFADDVAEADLAGVTAEVIVYNRENAVQWFVPAQMRGRTRRHADAPATVAGAGPPV